jgi:hypothetical protein
MATTIPALLLQMKSLEVNTEFAHLDETNEASHLALGILYEGLNEQFDRLAEQFLGSARKRDKAAKLPRDRDASISIMSTVAEVKAEITRMSDNMIVLEKEYVGYPHIQNILCEIHEILDKAIYRLSQS